MRKQHSRLVSGEQKVLEVCWTVEADQLVFEFTDAANVATLLSPTKKNVISIIGCFYDPLCFLLPVTIQFKLFMQGPCGS